LNSGLKATAAGRKNFLRLFCLCYSLYSRNGHRVVTKWQALSHVNSRRQPKTAIRKRRGERVGQRRQRRGRHGVAYDDNHGGAKRRPNTIGNNVYRHHHHIAGRFLHLSQTGTLALSSSNSGAQASPSRRPLRRTNVARNGLRDRCREDGAQASFRLKYQSRSVLGERNRRDKTTPGNKVFRYKTGAALGRRFVA